MIHQASLPRWLLTDFVWSIQDFNLLRLLALSGAVGTDSIASQVFHDGDVGQWHLFLHPAGPSVSICLERSGVPLGATMCHIALSLVDTSGELTEVANVVGDFSKTFKDPLESASLMLVAYRVKLGAVEMSPRLTLQCCIRILVGFDHGIRRRVSRSLADDLATYREAYETNDVVLKAGNTTVNASRMILSVRSPVFHAMLHGPYSEAAGVVEVKDIDECALKNLVEFAHTDRCDILEQKNPNLTDLLDLLVAADKYSVKSLYNECVKIVDAQLCDDKSGLIYVVAERINCLPLLDAVTRFKAKGPLLPPRPITCGPPLVRLTMVELQRRSSREVYLSIDWRGSNYTTKTTTGGQWTPVEVLHLPYEWMMDPTEIKIQLIDSERRTVLGNSYLPVQEILAMRAVDETEHCLPLSDAAPYLIDLPLLQVRLLRLKHQHE